MKVVTRFAPSPTGSLHIGSIRTALYAWLYAQKMGGDFLLRIEDTDTDRYTKGAVDAILQGVSWLNINSKHKPFYQTQRLARYTQIVDQLVAEGKAYPCYCSKETVAQIRQQQLMAKEKPRYLGTCRNLSIKPNKRAHVIRFRNPQSGIVRFYDHVHGTIAINNNELDDLVIRRSNGMPTYNLCATVDDWDMKVTHVIRGEDHMNNTPRQINILTALGAPIPEYAHVAMILGEDGTKLSKRHGAVSVMQYRCDGYLPQALLNYLVRLGWAYGDQEIFSLSEMVSHFNLNAINKSASTINTKKLNWVNQQYIKLLPPEDVAKELLWHMQNQKINLNQGPELTDIVVALRERAVNLKELASASRYFYEDFKKFNPTDSAKHLTLEAKKPLQQLLMQLSQLNAWEEAELKNTIHQTMEALGLKMGKIGMPLRVAVTGAGQSPALPITLKLLGRQRVLTRIQKALDFINLTNVDSAS